MLTFWSSSFVSQNNPSSYNMVNSTVVYLIVNTQKKANWSLRFCSSVMQSVNDDVIHRFYSLFWHERKQPATVFFFCYQYQTAVAGVNSYVCNELHRLFTSNYTVLMGKMINLQRNNFIRITSLQGGLDTSHCPTSDAWEANTSTPCGAKESSPANAAAALPGQIRWEWR